MIDWFTQYLKPELMLLIPVLIAVGGACRKLKIQSWKIPLLLGGLSILLATIWTISVGTGRGWRPLLAQCFTGVTQGILAAASSVSIEQLLRLTKRGITCGKCAEGEKEAGRRHKTGHSDHTKDRKRKKKERDSMAKKGMRRPDVTDPHGTESNKKLHLTKNEQGPVPEIQGKAKRSKEKANTMVDQTNKY